MRSSTASTALLSSWWIVLLLALGVHGSTVLAAEDNGTSVEGCIGCHAAGSSVPVADIGDPRDAHYIDQSPDGPAASSGYRQLNIEIASVDVTGMTLIIDYMVLDENGSGVDNLFAQDGRFAMARLAPGMVSGDPISWSRFVNTERFTTTGGVFENLGGGAYRYTSVYDPTSTPVVMGQTLRVAVQISQSDLPPGNGWCDFDADLTAPNDCTSGTTYTRDIVQTADCNDCHGPTSDTQLRIHGHRTQVEYCVVCHNPDLGEYDMTDMTHKIHYGANLANGFGEYSDVQFPRDVDNCKGCHVGGGVDELNWAEKPSRVACGSCHDTVNFDTGENHGSGGAQPDNRFCGNCHPSDGPRTDAQLPVMTVHEGVARSDEAALYRGAGNGYAIEALSYDRSTDQLTVDFSATRDGQKMILQSDARWMNGARLAVTAGWTTREFTNEGSGSTPAPAQPLSNDGLDVGGVVTDLGNGVYRTQFDMPSGASDTVSVSVEGHPQVDIRGDGSWESLPVRQVVGNVNVELRGSAEPRRAVVDIGKCNGCHDAAGAGLALHGNNRVSEPQACVVCHNPNATDIRQRPMDPGMTPDGKREESIDMKRMIHGIHAGVDLENGLVIYGFGGSVHDYSNVAFTANNANCLTCHLPGTYSTDAAWSTLPSTIDSGMDVTDPDDDLNISPVSATCSSCHDGDRAHQHMVLNGASFMAPDDAIAVPEPAGLSLSLGALGALGALARRRSRREAP